MKQHRVRYGLALLLTILMTVAGCTGNNGDTTSSNEEDGATSSTVQEESSSESSSDSEETSSSQEESSSHTHQYQAKKTAATCTAQGYTTYTCSCGASYQDNYTSALGHSYGSWVVEKEATTSASGQKKRTCSRCGAVQRESIPQLVDAGAYVSEVVRLVNAQRTANGLKPLTEVAALDSYAQTRSQEIVSLFDHVRPDGSNPLEPVFSLGSYYTAGENIAYGYLSPHAVMDGWMNSPGHRANILNSSFSYIGVGCYQVNGVYYWTQIFAG